MREDEIIEYFGRHLVVLCISTRYADEQSRFSAYPGTIIRVNGQAIWITAGHNLKHIYDALGDPNVKLDSSVFADAFGQTFRSKVPIPADLENCSCIYIDDDELGLDFGAILLHPHLERLILANNVEILDDIRWKYQENITFVGHLMLGTPTEYTSEFVPPSGRVNVSPTLISIQTPPDTANIQTKKYPRFVGHISHEISLVSLKGMSGGPIFGFNDDNDRLRYWVVALQSSWTPESRIAYACPVPTIARFLERYLEIGPTALPPTCTVRAPAANPVKLHDRAQ